MERTMEPRGDGFYYERVSGWDGLFKRLEELSQENYRKWIFKGQLSKWLLESTFDRAFSPSGITEGNRQSEASAIEQELTRDFRRLYDGSDRQAVLEDMLYGISLMQHHGAPTRLMDFTYSPFIAAYFALQDAHDNDNKESGKLHNGMFEIGIWCFSTKWCTEKVKKMSGLKKWIVAREKEDPRRDKTFIPLYIKNPRPFVYPENPYLLHTRLARQQGVFLCPGDVSKSFSENLKALLVGKEYEESDESRKGSIYEIRCELCRPQRLEALNQLHRMNIDRASLFPGLDGFAKSMNYRFEFYYDSARDRRANTDC